jgi:mannose-1-phosphate guanylyltransferase
MNGTENSRKRWAIVLAGGFGRRLQRVTEAFEGVALPKQFCSFGAGRTLLQQTLDRIAPLIPAERTIVVVDESMQAVAKGQLDGYPDLVLVAQPCERGTGAGVLLPLMRVLDLDPAADVVLAPSDHHFRDASAFRAPVAAALGWIGRDPSCVYLLGVEPDHAATDLGWIVPSPASALAGGWTVAPVARFVEKPPREQAERLFATGALWNTMITVARGAELLRLFGALLPEVTQTFLRAAQLPREQREPWLRVRYERIPRTDFSAELLASATNLGVLPVSRRSGWTDLGTPQRLYEWIAQGRRAATAAARRAGVWEPTPGAVGCG